MQPIPEAVAWSLRADAWAQNPETPGESAGTVSRWSDVAATGRPAVPAEGVGWRTQTSEWRSTAESARWRQTTEWRSASGTHGWRQTTEAWQSGDAESVIPPQAEAPTRLPAISGTAWPTPADDQPGTTPSWQPPDAAPGRPPADATPAWQRPDATPGWQPPDATPSWQQPGETRHSQPGATPPWEPARGDERPAWQQFTSAGATPPWPPADAPPPRQPDARPSWDSRPSWQAFTETSRPAAEPSWREPGESRPTPPPSAPTSYAGSWSAPIDDGRHLVREDDRAAWRESAAGQARPADGPPVGRRRAPDAGSRTSGGTGWTVRSDADNWAGHTDTGSIPAFPDPATTDEPAWRRAATEPPATDGWRTSTTTNSWQSSPPVTDSWRSGDQSRTDQPRTDSWRTPPAADGWRSGDEARADGWRDTGSWRRDPEPGPPVDPWAQSAAETGVIPLPLQPRDSGAGGWSGRTDTGSWQQGTDTGSWQRDGTATGRRSRGDTGSWQRESENGSRADSGSWQRAVESGRTDTGSWQRETEVGGRSGRIEPSSWQRDQGNGRTDTGSWRQGPDAGRSDTGSWQRGSENGRTDTGSWQRGPDTGRTDTGSWQQGVEGGRGADTGSRRREIEPPASRSAAPPRGGEIERWSGPRPGPEPRTGAPGRGGEAFPARGQAFPAPGRGEAFPAPGYAGEAIPGRGGEADRGEEDFREPRRGRPPRALEPGPAPRRGQEAFREPASEAWRGAEPPRDFEAPRGPRRARREADLPRGPETRRGPESGQRSGGIPRGLEGQRGPARPEFDRGPDTPRDYADRGRRRERDTSWQQELASGAWHRDPESDVWLRDSDTGQWHRQEPEDEDDEDDDRGPRRGPRNDDRGNGGGRRAIESRDAVARRERDEPARVRSEPADPDGSGRRRATETRPARLQLTASAEPPLDPEIWRRDGEAPTRPIAPKSRPRAADMPVSAQPASWREGDQPDGWERDESTPMSAPPAQRRRAAVDPDEAYDSDPDELASPMSAPPDHRPRGSASVAGPDSWRREGGTAARPVSGTAAAPVSSQPGAWRAESQAAARTDAWRNQLRAEQGEPPVADDAATEIRPRVEPGAWREAGADDTGRGSATYREGNTGDWRRELSAGSELADGESRRISTSDFVPFRPPSRNGASASVKVPAANSAAEGATEVIARTGARWQDPPDTQWPPRGVMTSSAGTYERRPVSTLPSPSARQNDLLEPDEELEEDTGGPLAAVGYTVVWYGVPVVLFVLYMLVLNGPQQAHALDTLAGAAPQFGLSLVLSMLVAVGLRWASGSWKAASVGLAAAVMGGGLATVLTSAITGQSLS
ncbi:hypothetical protein [Actinoplanes nipponensis]|nr:hypothetical protein [Actinoplanes nipponensis]